jgi:hypothetical protein
MDNTLVCDMKYRSKPKQISLADKDAKKDRLEMTNFHRDVAVL